MDLLKEIIEFILARKKYWLFPIIILLLLFGILIVLGGNSPVALPFIYAIF